MPHANRPSGPGKPLEEQRAAVIQKEGIDEFEAETSPDGTPPTDPLESARHAERNARAGKAIPAVGSARREAREAPQPELPAAPSPAPGTWVLVADEWVARILQKPPHSRELEEVEVLRDDDARAERRELRRDAYGRRGAGRLRPGANITASASDDVLHEEGARFAAQVAAKLAEALQRRRFEKLWIVAAPHFLGQLRQAFDKQVNATVVQEVTKDLTHETPHELTRRLFPPVKPSSA
jgi:protein required for attachment to host cells